MRESSASALPGMAEDVAARRLDLRVSPEELAARRAAWRAPEPAYRTGVFAKYAAAVGCASTGATTGC